MKLYLMYAFNFILFNEGNPWFLFDYTSLVILFIMRVVGDLLINIQNRPFTSDTLDCPTVITVQIIKIESQLS